MQQKVLVLGARGRFGRNAALAFEKAGWRVRRFKRGHESLDEAARDVDVIVNGFNPAYPDWARELPVLTRDVIRAARRFGATVMVPGNVYVFGEQTPVPWGAATPHQALNPLGRVRIDMERAYAEAGIQVIILRTGDFIDTETSGNWFDKVMIKGLRKGVFTYPGRSDIPHAWAYLPDLAHACVELAEKRRALPLLNDIPFPGYTLSGEDMRAALETVAGYSVRLKRMSYLPLHLARPFWRMAAPLLEMRYLWNTPHWLDGSAFNRLLPEFRETPLEDALAVAARSELRQVEVDPNQPVPARP
ncbi:MAG: epimerase [Arenibacterium sp.]